MQEKGKSRISSTKPKGMDRGRARAERSPTSRAASARNTRVDAETARRIVLDAQGFGGEGLGPRGGVAALVKRLGAIQLDTISVLARSHELIPYSRLGAIKRATIERAYWGGDPAKTFEYWAHAASIVPVESWRYFGFRRRAERANGWGAREIPSSVMRSVRSRLAEGPVTATDLGGAKKSGAEWFDRSPEKHAAEWPYWIGEVVCARRAGWKRVYDLPERALPEEQVGMDASDEDCFRYLAHYAVEAMGIATRRDIADYFRLGLRQVDAGLRESDLTAVDVEGWEDPAWAATRRLESPAPLSQRTTLLSPFDSLTWERSRMERIFGFRLLPRRTSPRPSV